MEKRLEQTQILYELLNENNGYRDIAYDETVLYCIVLYCIVVGSRMLCSRRLIVQTLAFSCSYLHRQVSPPETLVVKEGTTWTRNGR